MELLRRLQVGVTLRRVVAFLLLGGFAEAIAQFLNWLVSVGADVSEVATLRACLLAGASLAAYASLIYLAVLGLGPLLDYWRSWQRSKPTTVAPLTGESDPTVSLEGSDAVGTAAAGWTREGGGRGRGSRLR